MAAVVVTVETLDFTTKVKGAIITQPHKQLEEYLNEHRIIPLTLQQTWTLSTEFQGRWRCIYLLTYLGSN